MTKFIKYVWLLLAVGAFIGVCTGATHHLFTMGISALMYAVCRNDGEEENDTLA